MNAGIRRLPLTLILLLLAAAGGLTIYNPAQQLPPAQWARAFSAPDIDDVRQMLFHYSLLPRLTVSLLAGAGPGWSACCSSRCCAIRWRSRRRSALPPARSSA